jgi:transposase
MKNTYSPEIRQRAVRLYQEQRSEYPTQWAATVSIASKFGCTPETLRTWIKKFEAGGRLRKRKIKHAKPVAAVVTA